MILAYNSPFKIYCDQIVDFIKLSIELFLEYLNSGRRNSSEKVENEKFTTKIRNYLNKLEENENEIVRIKRKKKKKVLKLGTQVAINAIDQLSSDKKIKKKEKSSSANKFIKIFAFELNSIIQKAELEKKEIEKIETLKKEEEKEEEIGEVLTENKEEELTEKEEEIIEIVRPEFLLKDNLEELVEEEENEEDNIEHEDLFNQSNSAILQDYQEVNEKKKSSNAFNFDDHYKSEQICKLFYEDNNFHFNIVMVNFLLL